MAPFWDRLGLFIVLVAATVYAGVWGYTSFYGSQFLRTPVWAWPFVPDSPGATTFWLIAAIGIKFAWDTAPGLPGRLWVWFTHLAAVLNIKVGLWTVFVLFYYYDHFFGAGGAQAALEWVLVFAHLGMIPFALLLARKALPMGTFGFLAILGVTLATDFIDYALAPLFFPEQGWELFPNGVPAFPADKLHNTGLVTTFLSVATTTALAFYMRMRGPPVDRDVGAERRRWSS